MENNLNNLLYSIKDKVSKNMENKYQKPSTIINNFYCEAQMNTRSFTDHIVKSLVKAYIKALEKETPMDEEVLITINGVSGLSDSYNGYDPKMGNMDENNILAINLIMDYHNGIITEHNYELPQLIHDETFGSVGIDPGMEGKEKRVVLVKYNDNILRPAIFYQKLFENEGFNFEITSHKDEEKHLEVSVAMKDLKAFIDRLLDYKIDRDLFSLTSIDEKYIEEIKAEINEKENRLNIVNRFKALSDTNINLIIYNIFKYFVQRYQEKPLYYELSDQLSCYTPDTDTIALMDDDTINLLKEYTSKFDEVSVPVILVIPCFNTKGKQHYLPVIGSDFKNALKKLKISFKRDIKNLTCKVTINLDDFESLVMTSKKEQNRKK